VIRAQLKAVKRVEDADSSEAPSMMPVRGMEIEEDEEEFEVDDEMLAEADLEL